MRILLVEDDDAIAAPLAKGLRREGYDVHHARTGAAALSESNVDLYLLDLGLPDLDGREVCRRIRGRSAAPIIMITARGDEIDRVVGLELGADDYLVKPFGFRELVARIRAVSRRAGNGAAEPAADAGADVLQTLGTVEIDRRQHRVRVDGEEVALSPKEFALLALLAEDPGALRTRSEILDRVWDPHWYGPTKTLDVHVAALRKKLRDATMIETVRGVGFRVRSG
ncbi:MAG TPA: response regulator transcription factor [Acidimicrobiales bacterium]